MLEALLGSKEQVLAIFDEFRRDPQLGVIYPAPFADVPYWAHTWLRNRPVASALLPRLGLEVDFASYLDFPAGSMFWARVPALRRLLDLGLRYQDFPEESGQTDGTIQHTLERCFVLVARSDGFTDRVIERDRAAHRMVSSNHKNLHQYFDAPIAAKLHAAAGSADVVSFDIFDTLLLRAVATPDSAFLLLEERIARELGIDAFMDKRKAAEAALRRQKTGGDVSIREIYAEISRQFGIPPPVAAECLRTELEGERALLRPRPEVVCAAREMKRAGKRVILVSDMYLQEQDLRDLLSANGIDFYDALYVSSEVGLRKDHGTMWDHVLAAEKVDPQRLLHVGDNEHSDVQLPVDRRIATRCTSCDRSRCTSSSPRGSIRR